MSAKRKVPVIATIVVLVAVAIMVRLGFWQLDRLDQKEALIAQYAAASQMPVVSLEDVDDYDGAAFRTVRMACPRPLDWTAVAGRNQRDQTGYVHRFACSSLRTNRPVTHIEVLGEIGWSADPGQPDWSGGELIGVLVPLGDNFNVVAQVPQAGLEASATPDPNDLPNNHLAYAVQWFLFALTALVIYVLALRKRWRVQS